MQQLFRAAFWLILVGSIGCGKFAAVEGVVTLDGQPLAQATLSFVPQEREGKARDATARADAEGYFRVKTNNSEGVIPGRYKVLVSKRVPPKGLENPKNVGEAIQATQR